MKEWDIGKCFLKKYEHCVKKIIICQEDTFLVRGRRGIDRLIVGFTTTYVISAYHH